MDENKAEWPLYEKSLLSMGNSRSNVGLCTLWTPKDKVLQSINPDNYNVAGQCYSSEGISLIIRNILANKTIKHLILYGHDLSHTGDAIKALSKRGLDERKIRGFPNFEIDSEIPVEAIQRFRERVVVYDRRARMDLKSLDDFLKIIQDNNEKPWGEPEIYSRSLPVEPEFFPSERTGFVVRGKNVADTWLRILDVVIRFGYIKPSQYGQRQQEITGLTSIVTSENPNKIKWADFFQFTKEHLEEYLPQLMSGETPESVKYTYGSRLRNHKGIDQISAMIDELKKAIFSRRAVGVTWDVEVDYNNPNSPCIDLVQALAQDKLNFTVYIRSNDMFKAWPENAIATRAVQYEIAKAVGREPGDLIIVSNSAHIYEDDWNKAKTILNENKAYLKRFRQPDPRGNILIELEDEKIKVTHLNPDGKRIGEFYSANARDAYRLIAERQMISQVDHALDIGAELGKAEVALVEGRSYVQDKPLKK